MASGQIIPHAEAGDPETVSRARTITRILVQSALRPRLAARLAAAAWRFRRRRWYARPPFLPLPPPEYLRWRVETAFGGEDADVPAELLLRYLRWSEEQVRAARPTPAPRAREAGIIGLRAILVILVVLAAVLAIPPVRSLAAPALEPGKAMIDRSVGRLWVRARDRIFGWSVRNEARTLAQELQKREIAGQTLPRPQDFQAYLQRRTISGSPGLDKWGAPYYMLLGGDSITVVSPGPDGRPGTDDDIRESVGRNR